MKNIKETLGFAEKRWTLHKWGKISQEATAFLQHGGSIEDAKRLFGLNPKVLNWKGNVALNEGLALMLDLLIGAGGTVFSNANAYLGVGDSSAGESPSHTGLQASTNKLYVAMDTSYPIRSTQTMDWRSTFGSAQANFAWEEFTVANGSSDSATNLNRKVTSKGTKSVGETWTLSLQVTAS